MIIVDLISYSRSCLTRGFLLVVRTLVYVYEEQTGHVKLAGRKSSTFSITNGTMQGSVISPTLWCVYLDDLIKKLRDLKLGVYVAGVWMGATGYADDLLLLAPVRSVLAEMVRVCEEYGKEHNMVFSTDPVQTLSKTKCMFFCGNLNNVSYPDSIYLDGKALPWVVTAEHLGHTLHQSGSMEHDCKVHRAQFINKSIDLREKLHFARASEVLKGMRVYCCDSYGSMLWNLRSESAESYFKCWNTAVKLMNDIPRSTFTYLVEGYFAQNQTSLRNQVLARYTGFFHSLLNSPSEEVRLLVNLVARDPSSNTADNLAYVRELTQLSPWNFSPGRIKTALPSLEVPEKERWRLGLLTSLLKLRHEKHLSIVDKKRTQAMIDSLCSS